MEAAHQAAVDGTTNLCSGRHQLSATVSQQIRTPLCKGAPKITISIPDINAGCACLFKQMHPESRVKHLAVQATMIPQREESVG